MHGLLLRPPVTRSAALLGLQGSPRFVCRQCILSTAAVSRRGIQISSAPVTEFPKPASGDAFGAKEGSRDDTDARFEVLGSPYSLLSVQLSASQNLFTRRGSLVSVAGKVENAQSTLSILPPARRAALGIPFLYQRISSTTPLTLLIGTRTASTTLFTLRLDGTTDWVVAQRQALLAWTGHTLAVKPQTETGLGLAHWGQSFVTGRGLVALAAPGYIYPVTLAAGEELVVHPSHVVAYAVSSGKNGAPKPFRLRTAGSPTADTTAKAARAINDAAAATAKATAAVTTKLVSHLHVQAPAAVASASQRATTFWQAMRDTETYRALARGLFALRTVLRRSLWGDRLFVHIRGPTTLLLSSRGVRVAEVLSRDEVNAIADTEPGVVAEAVEAATVVDKTKKADAPAKDTVQSSTVAVHVAEVKPGGKVAFTEAKDLKQFVH